MTDNVQDIELGTLTSSGWDVTAGEREFEAVRVLAQSAVAASAGANTDENVLATITIPAGAMGLNGALRVHMLWTYTNSGNNKTLKMYFGGLSGTTYLSVVPTTTASFATIKTIRNRGAANSQVGESDAAANSFTATTDAVTTSAIDTTAVTTIVISGQKASSGETLTLEAYTVELLSRG